MNDGVSFNRSEGWGFGRGEEERGLERVVGFDYGGFKC